MSFNGSGQFLLNSGGLPYVTGTTISSTHANNLNTDLATGLSTCITKDGQTTVTANLPMSTFRHTNVGAATARTDYARASQVQDSSLIAVGTIAGTNTITGSLSPAITAYAAGQFYTFIPANTNTGATTININSVGAKNIFRNNKALVGGEIKKNVPLEIEYDGTQFQITGNGANLSPLDNPKAIAGLTYSNNVGDATNDLDIAAGTAVDSTGVYVMRLLSAITKQSDAAWAVGTNAGGLDDIGSAGNNDFYIWLIARSDTGVVDVLYSLSSTAPTMPSNYDYMRLIGWFKRSGGAIVAMHTYEIAGGGLEFLWDSPTLDISLANTLTTTARTDAVKSPLNLTTEVMLNVVAVDAAAAPNIYISCPDLTDLAPSVTVAPLATMRNSVTNSTFAAQIEVRTSATGTIRSRADVATVDSYLVVTLGFKWARRN